MPVAAAVPALIGGAASVGAAALGKPKAGKDPNAYLAPYLKGAAGEAQSLFNQGGPQVYDGATVAGPGDVTQQAQQAILARAQSGNPLIDQAQGFVSQGLGSPISTQFGSQMNPYASQVRTGGGMNPFAFGANPYGNEQNPYASAVDAGSANNPYASGANPFGGASNPYLDATFQHAAQQGQKQLDSAYARGGRNIAAGAPASADMLAGLSREIYAPAYENERNRQLSYGQQQLGIGGQSFENAQARGLQSNLAGQQIGAQGFENAQNRNLSFGSQQLGIGATGFENAQDRRLQSGLAAQGIGAQGYENAQGRALSDLTSQRGLQQNLLSYASPLAAQDYMDLSMMQGVGAQQDQMGQAQLSDTVNRFNQQQMAPQNNLDAYLARLSGLAGKAGQVQQPMQSPNYLAAGLGGAMLGQQLYPQVPTPPVGMSLQQLQQMGLFTQ